MDSFGSWEEEQRWVKDRDDRIAEAAIIKRIEAATVPLLARIAELEAFAKAHGRWEANALNDGGTWVDEMISDDEFHELQELRNRVLKTAKDGA